jgi:hypothetical protein
MDKNALWDDSNIRKKQCYVNRKKTAQCGRGLEIPQTNGYHLKQDSNAYSRNLKEEWFKARGITNKHGVI